MFSAGCGTHREASDLGARFLRGDANVVCTLKVEPKLAAGAEPMSQAQRGIAADRPLPLDDLRYPVRRHLE